MNTNITMDADGLPRLTVEQVAPLARLHATEGRSHGDGLAVLRELWRVSQGTPGALMSAPIIEWAAGIAENVLVRA